MCYESEMEKTLNSTGKRTRSMMYVQQMSKLPFDLKDIDRRLNNLNCEKWAYIVHNRDTNKIGKPITEHLHLMMSFENGRHIAAVSKKLSDRMNTIQDMTKRSNTKNGTENGFAYLVHATKGAVNKYQYDVNEVVSNFDYKKFIEKYILTSKRIESETTNETDEINRILDLLGAGVINTKIAREKMLSLGGHVLARNADKIDTTALATLEVKYSEWVEEHDKSTRKGIPVIWIYGTSGTGKTRFARTFASRETTFVTGGSNDTFQGYFGQSNIVLDELRPGTLKFEDLLRIIDPFSTDSMTIARYKNRHLIPDDFLITSPYNPRQFFEKSVSEISIDQFEQLIRRISNVLYFDKKYIYEIDKYSNDFDDPIILSQVTNKFYVSHYENPQLKLKAILEGNDETVN
ncbi:hypothetical protein FHL03_03835 [Lactobacillus salsicarnum]|uniref:Replication protein n=2 Tax=Companilactobacillus mishanensis TaxID=2486008 RepID=A0ABW9P5R4_9LACO|nr:hypothetical protein [Companilactobacillus mishanensis]